ncbi:C40 family peptidase [Flavobacterium cerinum]|nr:C40 family peptidase [Flavobacterium cerinum]
MISWKSSAQIITSKKEAQKKGIYSYSETKTKATSKPTATIDKVVVGKEIASMKKNSNIVAYQPVVKEQKIRGQRTENTSISKSKKTITLTEVKDDPNFTPEPEESYLANQIVNNAMQFEGVRYRGGGTTKAGMDCSGMVYATFQIFDTTLPRSSHEMAKAGKEIKLSEVKKGDLLFFKNNRRRSVINHVGLVTEVTPEGEVKFIHSSTSSGVIVSSMNEPYNARTFVQASRVVED